MKILILDDFLDQVRSTIEYLEREEYVVLLATNAEEVYQHFEKNKPDICFFDVMLETEPNINGIDIARKILGKYKVPIVIYTQASYESLFYEQAKDLGVIFEDKNKMKNFAWLESLLSDVIAQSKEIDGNLKSFFLTETQKRDKDADRDPVTTLYQVQPSDILALTSYTENGQSYTYIWIDKSSLNENTPIHFTQAIGNVYAYLSKKADMSHLAKISAGCYMDLSRIKKIKGITVTMNNGTSIGNLATSTIKEIEKRIPILRVSHVKNG